MVLLLNLSLVAALVTVGLTAHSLAVFAEGGGYLLDAAGVAVALAAVRLAARPPTPRHPAGHPNATSVAGLVNAGWLLLLELLVAGARAVDGLAVLVVSGVAAVVMAGGALILRGGEDGGREGHEGHDSERDLSVAAVLLDTAADAAAAAGVAAAGGIILATGGWYWLDPAVALAIAVVVGCHAAALIRKVLRRLSPGRAPRRAP